jgi:hypothetical protein
VADEASAAVERVRAAELFGADDALTTHATPSRFGSRAEMTAGFIRAVGPPGGGPAVRAGV